MSKFIRKYFMPNRYGMVRTPEGLLPLQYFWWDHKHDYIKIPCLFKGHNWHTYKVDLYNPTVKMHLPKTFTKCKQCGNEKQTNKEAVNV
jgi:hypothetical protein